ncbi:MAG: Hpt domain-containing protein [Oscillospiraceae bacterium]
MTLEQLYAAIDGDYERAQSVLRVEKLIDKHIRRLPGNAVFFDLFDAAKTMDATRLFESAHAIKGVCGNLGLVKLAQIASEIAEEYRPGNPRRMTDDEVAEKVAQIEALYQKAVDGVRQYEQAGQ